MSKFREVQPNGDPGPACRAQQQTGDSRAGIGRILLVRKLEACRDILGKKFLRASAWSLGIYVPMNVTSNH